MRLITIDDIRDIYIKIIQRGFSYLLSKASLKGIHRTESAFNDADIESSNWWIIPKIKQHWNTIITGYPQIGYENYISQEIFTDNRPLKVLSIGSGICSHELLLAELNPHWTILCLDISNKLLDKASEIAKEKRLQNITFLHKNILEHYFPDNEFDLILFHESLHHFNHIETFLLDKVHAKLKPKGQLLLHEYVGADRLQFTKAQLAAINNCLLIVDKPFRRIYKTPLYKNKVYGPGVLRMIIADPSECVDSAKILPSVHALFDVVVEKSLGGTILMSVLKDISHHFVDIDKEKEHILDKLITFENTYLKTNQSDFIFGIYQKKN